jgi:hypothetical protein
VVDAAAPLVSVAELSALPQLSETPVQSQNTLLPPSCRLVSRRSQDVASASSKLVRVLVWTEGSGAVLRDGGGSERGGTATKLTDY